MLLLPFPQAALATPSDEQLSSVPTKVHLELQGEHGTWEHCHTIHLGVKESALSLHPPPQVFIWHAGDHTGLSKECRERKSVLNPAGRILDDFAFKLSLLVSDCLLDKENTQLAQGPQ